MANVTFYTTNVENFINSLNSNDKPNIVAGGLYFLSNSNQTNAQIAYVMNDSLKYTIVGYGYYSNPTFMNVGANHVDSVYGTFNSLYVEGDSVCSELPENPEDNKVYFIV